MMEEETLLRSDYRFEVCANSVESCLQAQSGGADRIELCAGIPEGGTTPSYGEIKQARDVLDIRLHVIIRPRGGDFLYSKMELERMAYDIDMARQLGADGVVFGCLCADGEIDMEANSRLKERAEGMSVTFHRAFDCCKNPSKALQQLIGLGFDRILTSGQEATAEKGISWLRRLREEAQERIIILAGCGVNQSNISRIRKETGIREFHFSARTRMNSSMNFFNKKVYMGAEGADEYAIDRTTSEKVRSTITALLENR